MLKFHKYIIILLIAASSFFIAISSIQANNSNTGKKVYVIPVEDEVERGLESFIQRTTEEAAKNGANHIIFEIDTPGGRVDAAGNIAEILQGLKIPTTSFIVNRALSAGSYIALNTDTIYMEPQATMGASGVINQDGTAASKKAQSAWIAAMKTAAESTGKNPLYAIAMADPSIDLPEYGAGKGEFLTLGAKSAKEVGYSEGTVRDRSELLAELKLSNATVIEKELTLSEKIARFITNPVVVPILLSLASLGLIIEVFSPGFGIPGIVGLVSLVLFFYGHVVAGLAGMEAIVLLVIGLVLIVAEFFVPGGIVGLLGIGAIIVSLIMSGQDIGQMTMSIGIAFIVALIAVVILFRTMGLEKGIFRHIILKDRTMTEQGYVSSANRLELIGLHGQTVTPLRPSGTAVFDDERIDVVTEGGFIDKSQPIRVVKVEGVRVVVRELNNTENGQEEI